MRLGSVYSRRRETLCPSADVAQGEMAGRVSSRRHSRTGCREFAGMLGQLQTGSGWEWNRSQPCQGTIELVFPGPTLGKMQSEAARRVGEPSGDREEPPPEGLGGHHLLTQTDARCPASQVVRHHLHRQPGAVGVEAV